LEAADTFVAALAAALACDPDLEKATRLAGDLGRAAGNRPCTGLGKCQALQRDYSTIIG
jgi:hypothetical protein